MLLVGLAGPLSLAVEQFELTQVDSPFLLQPGNETMGNHDDSFEAIKLNQTT